MTINAVAPSAFMTPFELANLQREFAGLALMYSATAEQCRRVETYEKETDADDLGESKRMERESDPDAR